MMNNKEYKEFQKELENKLHTQMKGRNKIMNYNFCLKFHTEERGFTSHYTGDFNEVLNYTKNSKVNGLMEVIEKKEDIIVWSNPGGFTAQCVYIQDCKTTGESLEKLKTYKDNRNTLIVDLINKYCGGVA